MFLEFTGSEKPRGGFVDYAFYELYNLYAPFGLHEHYVDVVDYELCKLYRVYFVYEPYVECA